MRPNDRFGFICFENRKTRNKKGTPQRASLNNLSTAIELRKLIVRAEHIHNLMYIQLLHVLASRLQILTWVEVIRMLS